MNPKGEIKTYAAIIITFAIVIAAIILSLQSQGEAYTVLYFTNPTEPLVYNAKEKTVTVNYTVENHELEEMHYSYFITMELYKNQTFVNETAKEGKFSLKNNEKTDISERLKTKGKFSRIRVSVSLYKEGSTEIYRRIWNEITV